MLLLSNLAEPEWISVNCTDRILSQLFCVIPRSMENTSETHRTFDQNKTCPLNHILWKTNCYNLLWYQKKQNKSLQATCFLHKMNVLSEFHILNWEFLVDATQATFPPFLIANKTSHKYAEQIYFKKYLYILRIKSRPTLLSNAEGHVICQRSEKNSKQVWPNIFFLCNSGGFVSNHLVCDGIIDCPNDNGDETDVVCDQRFQNKTASSTTHHTEFDRMNRECVALYFSSLDGVCYPFFFQHNRTNIFLKTKKHGTVCEVEKYSDCNTQSDSSMNLNQQVTMFSSVSCSHSSQLPCGIGDLSCFGAHDTCTYLLHENKHLRPCSNGGHLENCKDFECNLKFKCFESHCIFWEYICDGKWDCPQGDDESYEAICGGSDICVNMFVCRASRQTCVHLGNVCDGEQNCPRNDDELSCGLKRVICPTNCACFLFALDCNFEEFNIGEIVSPFISITVAHGNISNLERMASLFPQALQFKLARNCVRVVCQIKFPNTLMLLDLDWNKLELLTQNCFPSELKLRVVKLSRNTITFVASKSFANLLQLRILSLSGNPILSLPAHLVQGPLHLQMLSIADMKFEQIELKILAEQEVTFINTSDYHVCCVAPTNSVCSATIIWYRTCSHLLPTEKVKIFYWVISSLVVVFSGISGVAHFLTKTQNAAFSWTVIFINVDDALCGLYLIIIWVADLVFGDSFFVKQEWWRSSGMCISALYTLLWFTVLTQFMLSLLSVSRLMVVMHPVDSKYKRTKPVMTCILINYTVSGAVSLILTLVIKLVHTSVPTNLCLPLLDPTNSVLVISILTWFVVSSQLVTSVVILCTHILLVNKVYESQKATRKSKSDDNTSLVVQLLVITLSNILCWLPVNTLYISAMFLSTYPVNLVSWSTVIGIPVNSIINPSVLTVICIKKHVKSKKKTSVPATNQQLMWTWWNLLKL